MAHLKSSVFGLGFMLAIIASVAKAEVVTVEATGVGQTRVEAVTHGLVEAVQKATGVRIDQLAITGLNQKVLQVDANSNQSSGLSTTSKDLSATVKMSEGIDAIASQSGGAIRTYTVLSSQSDSRGYTTVKLKVDVEKFKSVLGDQAKRVRLIVAEFEGLDPEMATRFQDGLKAYFVQARRFSVLDRSETQQYAKEIALATGQSAALTERVRYGQVLGADFILTGKVRATRETKKLADPVTGSVISRDVVSADVTFTLIEIATRQILWTNTVKLNGQGSLLNALDRVVPVIGNQASETLFPLKIVTSDDPNALILNQGGQSVSAGQKLALVELGRELTDPDTKESLGRKETQVGTVEVTRVQNNVSYAKLLDGKYTKGATLILRQLDAGPSRGNAAPAATANPGTKSKAFDD